MKALGHKNMFGRCGMTMTRIGRFAIKIVVGAGIALMELTTESWRVCPSGYSLEISQS